MTKLTRSRHKTDPNRYLYRDEDRPLQEVPVGYGASEDWNVIEEIRAYDQIPEKYRGAVEAKGYRIYWQLVVPKTLVREMPMTAAQAERLKQLADDLQLLGLFKHNLTQAEAERRIALLGVKLMSVDKPAHSRRYFRLNTPAHSASA
jgi:hypothetical protein